MSAEPLTWFRFDAYDWHGSYRVRALDPVRKGIYITLLVEQWINGPIPDDDDLLAVIAGTQDVDAARSVLSQFFERDEEGWVNHKLEKTRRDQHKLHEARRRAGRRGGKASAAQRLAVPDQAELELGLSGDEAELEQDSTSKEKLREEKGTTYAELLWGVWLEELAGSGRHPTLTTTRSKVLTALYNEQLSRVNGAAPEEIFRKLLLAVKKSKHHMSERAYQMPESLFRNAERRETWVLKALSDKPKGRTPGRLVS